MIEGMPSGFSLGNLVQSPGTIQHTGGRFYASYIADPSSDASYPGFASLLVSFFSDFLTAPGVPLATSDCGPVSGAITKLQHQKYLLLEVFVALHPVQ